MQHIIFSFFLFSISVFSIPTSNRNFEFKIEKRQQATCPRAACPLYALNNYTKKTPCSGGCILQYNYGGSIATCNSALSTRLTSKPIKC
jgi:hypothetical protein